MTTITANDVDSSPALTYRIANINDFGPFSIDRYGGKVTLTGPLDAEEENEYVLQVMASDGIHQVTTDLTIRVNDINDNAPKFHQAIYVTTLSGTKFNQSINLFSSLKLFLSNKIFSYFYLQMAGLDRAVVLVIYKK